jgi:hypothetical protein
MIIHYSSLSLYINKWIFKKNNLLQKLIIISVAEKYKNFFSKSDKTIEQITERERKRERDNMIYYFNYIEPDEE